MNFKDGDIMNLQQFDAFAEAETEQTDVREVTQVHLRVQQRNGRKCITTVQGLSDTLDLKKLLKQFKKTFNCNGSLQPDRDTDGTVVQMSGDQRRGVHDFLVKEGITSEDDIVLHGA